MHVNRLSLPTFVFICCRQQVDTLRLFACLWSVQQTPQPISDETHDV
jgi:hypothetical protein